MAEKNTYINGKLWNLGDANGVIANASQIKVGDSDVETELSKKLEESNLENYATKEYVDEKASNIPLTELETGNIDELIKDGIYSITTAEKAPIGTTGKLEVRATNNGIYQEWTTKGAFASRMGELSEVKESAYTLTTVELDSSDSIVSTTTTEGTDSVVILQPGHFEYTISGIIVGHLEIADGSNLSEATVINFNGLTINSDNQTAVIYRPSLKKLKINLVEGSSNFISAMLETAATEKVDKIGVIHSNSNLEISGTGSLAIRTNYGTHGIFASEITFSEIPHIYINCNGGHDGIHAGKSLFIENGDYEICYCNDAIGIGASTSSNAACRIWGGNFNFHDLEQDAIDASKMTNPAMIFESSHLSKNFTAENCSNTQFVNDSTAATIYGEGKIELDGGSVINPVDGVYTLSSSGLTYIATGYIDAQIKVTSTKIVLQLNNSYIVNTKIDGPTIMYTNSGSNFRIKSGDVAPYNDEDDAGNPSNNWTNIIKNKEGYRTVTCAKNLKTNGDGVLIIEGEVNSSAKYAIYGDGNKYFNNIVCAKYYLGADDDQYDEGTAGNSKQTLYIDNLTSDSTTLAAGKKLPSVYENQSRNVYIKELHYIDSGVELEPAWKNVGGIDKVKYNYTDMGIDKNFISQSTLTGEWAILENKNYATKEYVDSSVNSIDVILKYDDIGLANNDLESGKLKLGDIISVNKGASDDYATEYVPYIVVRAAATAGGGLILKEINSGTSSDTGSVKLDVTELLIGTNPENLLGDGTTTFEANIGDQIILKYIFESDNYSEVRGTVNCRLGSTNIGSEKVYPDGELKSWSYSTAGMNAGTYKFSIWGVESTGKRTETTTYTFKIGGLNVSSNFNEENVLQANTLFKLPITVSSADPTADITAHVLMDDVEIITESVRQGNATITIPAEHAIIGAHKLDVYLTLIDGEKTKKSNILNYNIVIANEGAVYALTDATEYTTPEGTRLSILLRAIELHGESFAFSGLLDIKNEAEETVYTNKYGLKFGSNLIELTGLLFDNNSTHSEVINGVETRYTKYNAKFIVSAVDDPEATPSEVSIVIRITENNYNISLLGEENLLCAFKSEGMSNLSETRDNWEDISGNGVSATFNNFNWATNGWLNDESGNTALTLNGGAYVELGIAPLEKEVGPEGLTISVDFQTEDILDADAKVISCLYEYSGTDTTQYNLRDAYGDYVSKEPSNIIKYFTYIGGYCWIDGITYPGDGIMDEDEEVPYKITFAVSDRAINYNLGDMNPSYNNPEDKETYNKDLPTDYKKYTGSTQETVTKQRGFYIDTQYAVLSNSSSLAKPEDKFHLNFSEKTRTKIDLIITRSSAAPYYFPSMIGYTNGCISLMQQIDGEMINGVANTDKFIQESPIRDRKFKVYLGCKASYDEYGNIVTSNTGSAKIYSVRIYNRALSPDEVLNNYAAEIPDYKKKIATIDNNDLLHTGSIPRTIPEICLIGYKSSDANGKYATKSSINQFIMQLSNTDEGSISDLKAMKEPAYIRYTDVSGNDWNFDGNYILPVRLQFQGTSSMVYPLKNYKFKIYNPVEASTKGIVGIQENGDSFSYGKKLNFDIGNNIEENTFTLKADFMDSSHCNNTGSANFISDYNIISGPTPASKINSKVRTTIFGYPVLIYYTDNPEDTNRKFLGVGNLNLDKSCTDSFGLDKEMLDEDGKTYHFGNVQFIEDDFGSDMLVRTLYTGNTSELIDSGEEFEMYWKGETVFGRKMLKDSIPVAIKYNDKYYQLFTAPKEIKGDGEVITKEKEYLALSSPKTNNVVALISEKGYLRSMNNDSIRNTQCSEFKANSGASGAGGFGNYSISSINADTELRYPDDGDLEDEEYKDYVSNVGSENALSYDEFKSPYYYSMQRMIKWVSTCSEEEFLRDLDKHFNRNYLMDYYLTILLLGGVDSLGKNLMIGTWGPENHLYKTVAAALDVGSELYDKFAMEYKYTDLNTNEEVTEYITPTLNKLSGEYEFATDAYGKPLFFDEDSFDRTKFILKDGHKSIKITTIPGECIWYPTFYDIDTVCGLDNAGQLIYDVDIEPGDQLSDGTAVYNTSDSHLWSKVRKYLGKAGADGTSILSERWATLRNEKFTVENLVNKYYYEKQIATIPEYYYNRDCLIKYVYEGPNEQKGSGTYLYCAHGSRYEQIKRWYSQRLYYLDTMFGRVGTTAASLRFNYAKCDPVYDDSDDYYASYAALAANDPEHYVYNSETGLLYDGSGKAEIAPINFNFKTYQPGYVGIRWKNGYKIHMKRARRGETVTISGNVGTSGDQEVFIYGGSNIKEIGDMYEYNVKSLQFANLNKLNKLVLGANGYSCVISQLDIGTNTYLSDLRLNNCNSLTNVNVSGCINLKNIDMTGSNITSVSLANGGALESISYSNSITSINLNNFINLTSITAPNLGNLTTFIVKNCPKILGSLNSQNAKAWALLQQTNNASSLTNIELTSYGTVEQRVLSNGEVFFFPDKYYSYATASKIKGEIYYNGTVIPTNYTKFESSYPDLKITYNNVTDVSNMFANYNNINLIGTMQVYTGEDIRGNKQYANVKYWIDADPESQAKWHNQTMYNKYGYSTEYSVNTKYYVENNKYYRMLGIYDNEDLEHMRAEIKKHLSNFKVFTKMDGMFKGLDILDYLDPDTFNGINISSATTNEMFSGCKNLRYFELPNDITKSELKTVYTMDGEEISIVDYDKDELEELINNGTIIKKEILIDPITGEETPNQTNIHIKGMRKLGTNMFFNCKKVRVYIPKTSDDSKITISPSAFAYNCYDKTSESQDKDVTTDRPAIFFARDAKDILLTTTEETSIPVENNDNLYYALNENNERRINYSNPYIAFSSDAWLREVYFGVKAIHRYDLTLEPGIELSYAECDDGIIIFDAKETGEPILKFNMDEENNYENRLNIKSITHGALRNLTNLTEIEIPIPNYDCLDIDRTRFPSEISIAGIFSEGKYYKPEEASNELPNNLTSVYVVRTPVIKEFVFTKLSTITTIGLSIDVIGIDANAFMGCKSLEKILWSDKTTEGDMNSTASKCEYIGNNAFMECLALQEFNIPTTVTSLGTSVFFKCTALKSVDYSASLTEIPDQTFMGCTSLSTLDDFTPEITKIGANAFDGCRSLQLFANPGADQTVYGKICFYKDKYNPTGSSINYFKNLEYIGPGAFTNVSNIIPSRINSTVKIIFPKTIKYIGADAFRQDITTEVEETCRTQIVWDGDYAKDFTQLVIGERAFFNIRVAFTPTINDSDLISDCVFIPKLLSIGDLAFYIPTNFSVALAMNTESEIGKKWYNKANKVIYEYAGIVSYKDENNVIGTYLLSNYNGGTAYLQKVTEKPTGSMFTIIPSIRIDGKDYKLIQILTGALDIYTSISMLTFEEGSNIELIEKQVLTQANAENLNVIQTYINGTPIENKVPGNLIIETNNYLAGYIKTFDTDRSGFITLGNYIIGYVETEVQKEESYTLDLTDPSIEGCSIIYDGAFSGAKCNKVNFSDSIKYIYTRAFAGSALSYLEDDILELPEGLISIGESAFDGCKFKKLIIPASVEEIKNNAFKEYPNAETAIGNIEYIEFKPGSKLSVDSKGFIGLQTEFVTDVQEPKAVNLTLKTLVIPNDVNWIATSQFYQFKILSQVTNLYLGNLENNGEKVDNYPLYLTNDESRNTTFEDTGIRKLDSEGNPLYCYKFYHDMAVQAGERFASAVLETTEAKSVCPVGDLPDKPGFSTSIDISNIRVFTGSMQPGLDPLSQKGLTRADILRIIAGFTSDPNSNFLITLKRDMYGLLTGEDRNIISITRAVTLDIIN